MKRSVYAESVEQKQGPDRTADRKVITALQYPF